MKKGLLFALTMFLCCSLHADDITLIKHAKKTSPVSEEKSSYMVKTNDTLYKILARTLGAKPEELPYLYHQFKQLNPGIKNLNIIKPDQKLVLPKINRTRTSSKALEMQEVEKNYYTIKQGEHLIKILKRVYKLTDEDIQKEYLKAISELNPEIKNLNYVIPGQRVKMPKQLVEKSSMSEKPASTLKQQPLPVPVQVPEKTSPVAPEPDETKALTKSALPESSREIMPPEAKREVDKPNSSEQKIPAKITPPIKEQKVSNPQESIKPQQNIAPLPALQEKSLTNNTKPESIPDNKAKAARIIKNSLIPTFKQMGATSREDGKYYMPVSGGNIAINTQEIPVLELDTGKKVILDFNGKLSPKVKGLIEKTFPDCRIISEPGTELEAVMDKVLNVSGYFSINKDGDPIIVGSEEKVKLSGKWIVYKDFTRSNVYVINILNDSQARTPNTIMEYAARFGLDIIDIGGKASESESSIKGPKELMHSYKALFEALGVKYKKDEEILLLEEETVNVSFKAPILAGRIIVTPSPVDDDIKDMLIKKGYEVFDSNTVSLYEIIAALGLQHSGPPLIINVADKRAEIEVPGIMTGNQIILETNIDSNIIKYLISTGARVLIW
jgi:hypothetical protein